MDLLRIARSFREAFDAQKRDGTLPPHMRKFPACCCGVISELLGHYLNSAGLRAEYVCGSGHAWVECEGVVVDITSDQFDGRPAVFVGLKDDWYRSLGESSRRLATRLENYHYGAESQLLREVLLRANLQDLGT
ncbi:MULTISPECIES: hypothetical protein [Pseudomonas]|uniref:hypothetical protein n=1 Tax=Pseudomonas TaxID=286 RepID=UPI000C88C5C2|nr:MULTISPECIES: hypothetical protein [Pseudomonas]MBP2085310.1 hypothetical protein [Pseudomonas sp. PvP089]MBP2088988.1 hypothetical protein [Pseudomonas sp. PvP088]MBP2224849.1 hypothetical protein [Pseudomonas putida]PMY79357.1 hypothetical protein C1X72_20715 [Pseudomonas sp. FW306-2-2C-D06B]